LRFRWFGHALAEIGGQITGYLLHPGRDLFRHQPDQRNFFRIFWILPELFPDFKISTGKFLGFSTFNPKFFGPANFRPEFFLNFQISNRKKFPENQIP